VVARSRLEVEPDTDVTYEVSGRPKPCRLDTSMLDLLNLDTSIPHPDPFVKSFFLACAAPSAYDIIQAMTKKKGNKTPTDVGKAAVIEIRRLNLRDEAKPHPRNERIRRHPKPGDPEWAALRRSMDNVYFDPLVWNQRNGMLISGHLRRKVLMEAGYAAADCSVVDVSEEQHLAMMVAANRMQGEDDLSELAMLLDGLDKADKAITGYTEDELETLLNITEETDEFASGSQFSEGATITIRCETEQIDDERLKRDLRAFCDRYDLKYKINTGAVT